MEIFVLLEKGGLPMKDAVELSFKNAGQIIALLENGERFEQILFEKQRGSFFKKLKDLSLVTDFSEALEQVLLLEKGSRKLIQTLVSSAAYPVFLLFFAGLLLWFFALQIVPSMSVYAESTDFFFLYLLCFLFTFFWICAFLAVCAGLLFKSGLLPGPVSRFLKNILCRFGCRIPVLSQAISYQLAGYLVVLFQASSDTGMVLKRLSEMKSAGASGQIAEKWLKSMHLGNSFSSCLKQEPLLDPAFVRFFLTGINAGRTVSLLRQYQETAIVQIEKTVRQISLWIQILSYSGIGLLAISVYQIMLAPLSMLGSF